ncbi:MAG: histidine phosphatase family protein [Sphingomonadales bacterium]|nr:histidine phosphatase family protein [Sphingomonadales bacterium]PIX63763.1 MAG: histidine phosphatase family protein [Sphingomonadales bacterium CG_4_10_14_3_um_filter_58_15]NCO49108.1 histidine phosphatase family protein [Sphingomonadales bacterium]NCP00024.1 histidine phosphatase family protein [Sphingomonadales bacterium]NCP27299.1 histidine phosphatase family protein [Sphingomonadales bacterium]
MSGIDTNGKRLFIARHGETIFNLAGRIQGDHVHTPLTRTGFAQADEMGRALARHLATEQPVLDLIASDTDRALQTLSVIAEHVGADWHQAHSDPRLREIDMGEWGGAWYRDLAGKLEIDETERLFVTVAPGGEDYRAIAKRLEHWLADQEFARDAVLISHGMTSRVLRGLLTGLEPHPRFAAPIAEGLPQGSFVQIRDGVEEIIHIGGGEGEKA